MKINKNNVTRRLNKIKLLGIKHSPTIFMVAGLAVCQKMTLTAIMATPLVKFLQQFSMTTLS